MQKLYTESQAPCSTQAAKGKPRGSPAPAAPLSRSGIGLILGANLLSIDSFLCGKAGRLCESQPLPETLKPVHKPAARARVLL